MILRTWRARAALSNPDGYTEHFRSNLAVELRAVDGFLGASLFRQERPDGIEFLVVTRWESMRAVRAFAGDDTGRAVVGPGAAAALTDFDDRVQHYELVEELSAAREKAPR